MPFRDKLITLRVRNLLAFGDIHPILRTILIDLLNIWPLDELTFTDFERTLEEDRSLSASGIHSAGPPWRAIDVRIWDLDDGVADELCATLNAKWTYDPNRPYLEVAYCKPHGTGPHIHLQVHYKSELRYVS